MAGRTVAMENSGLWSATTSSSLHGRAAALTASLDKHGDSSAVDGRHDSPGASPPLDGVSVEEDHTGIDNKGSSSSPDNNALTLKDVWDIEYARVRFLRFIVDHFITDHLIKVADSEDEFTDIADDFADSHYGVTDSEDEAELKTQWDPRFDSDYVGDQRFALPLMYVANLYETLVKDVDIRLASLEGFANKTIGLKLLGPAGLYRRLADIFPMREEFRDKYRRRKFPTSVETRASFPRAAVQEEKPVCLVVINGLDFVQNPNGISNDDAEWFKRLTGRTEVAISAEDYKFYCLRHKKKQVESNLASHIPGSNSASHIPLPNLASHIPGTHSASPQEDRTGIDNSGSLISPDNNALTVEDVSSIESAMVRLLQFVLEHFITAHGTKVTDSQDGVNRRNKFKSRIEYEGDPRFALPLMYVVNLYEALVKDVNIRLASLKGFTETTIGLNLVTLYKRLLKKYPKEGKTTYRRRYFPTSVVTRTSSPESVIQEEKPVYLLVINGLDFVQKPNNIPDYDAEWFKRLTGRNEVAISPEDYKFYCLRHEKKHVDSNSALPIPGSHHSNLASPNSVSSSASTRDNKFCKKAHYIDIDSETDNSPTMASAQVFRFKSQSPDQQAAPSKLQTKSISNQPQFHQTLNQQLQQTSRTSHFPWTPPDMTHLRHSPAILLQKPSLPQRPSLPPNANPLIGGRLRVMASTPAKFCDQCGTRYLSETSRFCSECGLSRQKVQKKVRMDSRSERVIGRNEVANSPHDSKFYSPQDEQKPVGSDSTPHIPESSTFNKTYKSATMAAAKGLSFTSKSLNQPAAPSKHQTQTVSHRETPSTLAKSRDGRKWCGSCGDAYYFDGLKVCACAEWTECILCHFYFMRSAESKICNGCMKGK